MQPSWARPQSKEAALIKVLTCFWMHVFIPVVVVQVSVCLCRWYWFGRKISFYELYQSVTHTLIWNSKLCTSCFQVSSSSGCTICRQLASAWYGKVLVWGLQFTHVQYLPPFLPLAEGSSFSCFWWGIFIRTKQKKKTRNMIYYCLQQCHLNTYDQLIKNEWFCYCWFMI